MAGNIGECIQQNSEATELITQVREQNKQNFDNLGLAIQAMIPNLAGYQQSIDDIRSSGYLGTSEGEITEEEIVTDIMNQSGNIMYYRSKKAGEGENQELIMYSVLTGLYDNAMHLDDFLEQNPGFAQLVLAHAQLREEMNTETNISDESARLLAECLAEVQSQNTLD